MEKGITRKQSAILQGIAIWMMMYHHLYSYPEVYDSLLPFIHVDAIQRIGWFCKLCVGLFAFVSGYGIYHVMSRKPAERFGGRLIAEYREVLVRILRLYGKLWLVILIFKGADFLILGGQFVAAQLPGNLTALNPTYNGTWWYAEQYAKMLLALPFLDLLFTRFDRPVEKKKWIIYLTLAGMALVGMLCSPAIYKLLLAAAKSMRPSFSLIFIVGYLTARFGLYQRADAVLRRRGGWLPICLSVLLIVTVTAVRVTFSTDAAWADWDFLLVPVLVYGVLVLLAYVKPVSAFWAWWGKHSTYIWLTHAFFVGWLFLPVKRCIRLDFLVYLAMMFISAAAAVLLKAMESGIRKVLRKGRT